MDVRLTETNRANHDLFLTVRPTDLSSLHLQRAAYFALCLQPPAQFSSTSEKFIEWEDKLLSENQHKIKLAHLGIYKLLKQKKPTEIRRYENDKKLLFST